MLDALRKGAKSWVAKILIGLLVASFAVWGIGDMFSSRLDSRVAKVGETEVSAERFANALLREQNRLTRQSGQIVSFDMMRAAGLDRRVLAGMMRDAAFAEELRTLGIEASDAAVADAIRHNTGFQGPGGQFSAQTYAFALGRMGLSVTEYESLTRILLGQQLLVEIAEAALTAAPGAGARIAAYQGERRAVRLLTLTLDMAPDPGMPDEGALREFYEANEPMFTEPERRWGAYVHVDAARLRAELTPDEATLRAAYEAELDRYQTAETRLVDQVTIPDRAAAEAAMGRLVSGDATFESLAAEFGVAERDLALGRIRAADLPEAAAAVVFDEAAPGIVGPVELPIGFAVYRIREITPGGATPFEQVRDRIAERLAQDQVVVQAPERANQIEELRAEGLSLAEIAQRAGVAHGRFDGLARDGSLTRAAAAEGVVASPAFIGEAFTALDAEERDLVETPDGGYLLIMVERIEPSALQPLDAVRDSAVAAWQEAERLAGLSRQAEALIERLASGTTLDDLATELGAALTEVGAFQRRAPPPTVPDAIVTKIFAAEIGSHVYAEVPADVAASAQPGVRIAEIASIVTPEPDALASASAGLEQALIASLKRDMAEYFARAIESSHGAQIEPGVIEEVYSRLGSTATGGQ